MGYVLFVGSTAALFAGFLLLTRFEARRGSRYFATVRESLDKHADQAVFVMTHVDFETLVRSEAKTLAAHIAHDAAHLTLLTVRAAERLLTRAVRHLRSNHGIEPARTAAPRAFVKTMREFKTQLATARPAITKI